MTHSDRSALTEEGQQMPESVGTPVGYVVRFRIVKRHHHHVGLDVFVPHADGVFGVLREEDAGEYARARLDGVAQIPHEYDSSLDKVANLGYVSVDRVFTVGSAVAV